MMERVQMRFGWIFPGIEGFCDGWRHNRVGLISLEQRRLRGELMEIDCIDNQNLSHDRGVRNKKA